ncbi:MAG: methionine--tRNA ligase [Chlamydiota bacterium]
MGKKLITSALLYANGPAHFGHIAGAYLPADIYARFCRFRGDEVLFLSGSDEYGVPITLSAEKEGRTFQEHVDKYHDINQRLFKKLCFSFDRYSRTTWEGHPETVLSFFHDLKENGYIVEREEDHLYSKQEGRFLADRYVVGTCPQCGYTEARGDECTSCGASYESLDLKNPRSKLTGSPLTLRKSVHAYLRFDLFKEELKSWIGTKKWKENVRAFSEKYIEGLRPRAITRDATWGIPIALDEGSKKVFYVWFDAPIGYISAAKDWAKSIGEPDRWKSFWFDPETRLVQFIGKDNIPFHAVFFPAMILGQNAPYKMVDDLPANEFLRLEGKKFSKSEGHFIDLESFFEKYSADQIRYYLAANAPETADADFAWNDFQAATNGDLLGKLGNFVHRVFVFTYQNLGGALPKQGAVPAKRSLFFQELLALQDTIEQCYANFQMRKACAAIMKMATLGNAFFTKSAPWKGIKEGRLDEVLEALAACFFCIQFLAITSFPIIPNTASKIWRMLGFTTNLEQESWKQAAEKSWEAGMKMEEPKVLFTKIEDAEIAKERAALQVRLPEEPSEEKKRIDLDQFSALDLRVVTILSAKRVEKSRKLLLLQVDLGETQRQVVSGIAQSLSPEDLVGKKVLFLANLRPIRIMGHKSEGMILAAGEADNLELPLFSKSDAGSVVS